MLHALLHHQEACNGFTSVKDVLTMWNRGSEACLSPDLENALFLTTEPSLRLLRMHLLRSETVAFGISGV